MPSPLITLEGASVVRAGRALLAGVDWRAMPGEHWALLGANGAGKTTLMRLARGDLPPTSGRRTYRLGAEPQSTPIGIRHRMALVSPELAEQVAGAGWRVSALDLVLAGFFDSLLLYREPGPDMLRSARATLEELGLDSLADAMVGELSTGELKKVLVARALAPAPDLLFLDECVEGLDADSRASFLAVLERASARAGLVVSAHRHDELPACVNRALVLEQGRVVQTGHAAQVLERCRSAAETPNRAEAVPETLLPKAAPVADELFSIRGGGHVMRGTTILDDADWTFRRGECWALTGPNGAGKSTLVRLLLGLADPLPTTVIRWWGRSGLPDMTEVRRRTGLVSTELKVEYEYDLTAEEVVLSGFFGAIGLYERPAPEQRVRAREAMDWFGLSSLSGRRLSQLSQGQARRVLLARAVAPGPRLLFLDEPTAGLDIQSRQRTLGLLQRLAESGLPLVLVTHHEEEMIPAVNRVLELREGRVASVRQV